MPKKFDSWSKKCHFRSFFGSFPVKFPPKKIFLEKFYCFKKFYCFVFEFQGGLSSYFWAIVLISAIISILDDFGSLLSARTVTVKGQTQALLRSRLVRVKITLWSEMFVWEYLNVWGFKKGWKYQLQLVFIVQEEFASYSRSLGSFQVRNVIQVL